MTLAGGKGDEAAQAAEYQAESSSARSKAIDHYRIALESAPNDLRDTVLIASIPCPIVHIEAVRAVDVRDGSRIHIGSASI